MNVMKNKTCDAVLKQLVLLLSRLNRTLSIIHLKSFLIKWDFVQDPFE